MKRRFAMRNDERYTDPPGSYNPIRRARPGVTVIAREWRRNEASGRGFPGLVAEDRARGRESPSLEPDRNALDGGHRGPPGAVRQRLGSSTPIARAIPRRGLSLFAANHSRPRACFRSRPGIRASASRGRLPPRRSRARPISRLSQDFDSPSGHRRTPAHPAVAAGARRDSCGAARRRAGLRASGRRVPRMLAE